MTGLVMSQKWDTFLMFFNAVSFDSADPFFGRDYSFYLFILPLWVIFKSILWEILVVIAIGVGLIYFIDNRNNRDIRRFRMIDGLKRLRHHPVIGGDNKQDQISDLGSAGTYCCKGFVAWGIQEAERLVPECCRIGTDMLGDSSSFAVNHFGLSYGIK